MRRSVLILGVVVLVIGLLLTVVGFLATTQTESLPSSAATGQGLVVTPSLIGSGTAKISWSGQSSQFRFSVYQCTNSACSGIQGTAPLANGAGASGSQSFTVNGGTSYAILRTDSGTNAVPITYSETGLTYLLLIAIVVIAVGAIVALLGYRMKAKERPAPAAVVEEESVKEMFVTRPFSGADATGTDGAEAAAATYRPQADEPSGPVYFEPTVPASAAGASGDGAAGARPPIQCPNCGTMNDFWLTNCRNCRRPLSKTG